SIVDSHDLDAPRQPRAQLCQRTLDVLDNGLRIGVAMGDHDSADGRMSAVEVRDPRRHVGSDGGVADGSDLQLRILRRLGPGDWLRVLQRWTPLWPDWPPPRAPIARHRQRKHLEALQIWRAADLPAHRSDHVAESDAARPEPFRLGFQD